MARANDFPPKKMAAEGERQKRGREGRNAPKVATAPSLNGPTVLEGAKMGGMLTLHQPMRDSDLFRPPLLFDLSSPL